MHIILILFVIYAVICSIVVIPYFEISIFLRMGRTWKPRLEGVLIGLALAILNHILFTVGFGGGGEVNILLPLFDMVVAIQTIFVCLMCAQAYHARGGAFLSKAPSYTKASKETQ